MSAPFNHIRRNFKEVSLQTYGDGVKHVSSLQTEGKKQWNSSPHLYDRKYWRIVTGSSATLARLFVCLLRLLCLFCSVVPSMIFSSGNTLPFLLILSYRSEPVCAVASLSVSEKIDFAFFGILELEYFDHNTRQIYVMAQFFLSKLACNKVPIRSHL
jgi:hypothetical protein